jgi:hypothetical protein
MFSYASILQAVLAFGMETTFFRYLNKFPDKRREVYNNGFGVIFIVSILFLFSTVPFTHTLAGWIRIGNDIPQKEFQLYIRYFIAVLALDAWCVSYIVISVLLVYLSFYVFRRNVFVGNGLLALFGLGALCFEWKGLKAIFN